MGERGERDGGSEAGGAMKLQGRTVKMLVVALLAVVTLLFFYKLLVPGRLAYQGDLTSSDVTELNFPRRDLLSTSLKHGTVPTWTDLIGDGFPLLGEGQTGIFYPPNLILFGLLDPVTAYNLVVILSFVLGMVFMYMFARSVGRGRYAASFAAIAFGVSGFFIARLRFMAMINSCCWLPLALYGISKFHKTKKWRFVAITGLALSMQIFAGAVQIFYISSLLVIVFFLFSFVPEVYKTVRKKDRAWRRQTGVALAAIVLAFVLAATVSAVQLLPSLRGINSSNRSGGMTFEESTVFPMSARHLAMFVAPYAFGNPATGSYDSFHEGLFWEDCAFSGVITLLLALAALVLLFKREVRKGGEVIFWGVILALSLLIALGSSTPVYRLLWRLVPGMGLFRLPQRFLVVSVVALAMLAAKTIDYLLTSKWFRRWAGPAAIAILVAELFLFSLTQVNTIDSRRLLEPPSTVAFLEQHPGRYRIAHIGELEGWKLSVYDVAHGWHGNLDPYLRYRAMLEPDFNMVFDVQAVASQGQYGVYRVKNLLAYTQAADFRKDYTAIVPDSAIRILGVQNVRYVFSPFLIHNPLLKVAARVDLGPGQQGIFIYQTATEQPRALITGDYTVVPHPEKVPLGTLFGDSYDPSKVILEQAPPAGFVKGGGGTAVITSYKPEEVRISTEVHGDGLLVLSDSLYPGWQATVDGRPTSIMRANYAFRAVPLSSGRHKVVFSYTPQGYVPGWVVTVAAIIILLAGLAFMFYRSRLVKRRKTDTSGIPAGPELPV